MEKKSLSRGLDDISDIFLSAQKDKKKLGGFSSEKLRDETCESCARIIRDPNKAPKCNSFTFENKKIRCALYGDPLYLGRSQAPLR